MVCIYAGLTGDITTNSQLWGPGRLFIISKLRFKRAAKNILQVRLKLVFVRHVTFNRLLYMICIQQLVNVLNQRDKPGIPRWTHEKWVNTYHWKAAAHNYYSLRKYQLYCHYFHHAMSTRIIVHVASVRRLTYTNSKLLISALYCHNFHHAMSARISVHVASVRRLTYTNSKLLISALLPLFSSCHVDSDYRSYCFC